MSLQGHKELRQHFALYTNTSSHTELGIHALQDFPLPPYDISSIEEQTEPVSGRVKTKAKTHSLLNRQLDQSESDSDCSYQLSPQRESAVSEWSKKEKCVGPRSTLFSISSTQQEPFTLRRPCLSITDCTWRSNNNSGVSWSTLLLCPTKYHWKSSTSKSHCNQLAGTYEIHF